MKIALFGREFNPAYFTQINTLLGALESRVSQFLVYENFFDCLKVGYTFTRPVKTFQHHEELDPDTFCMISIGGDGTLLDTITLLKDSGIPVLGINTGRLGFLSAVSTDEVSIAAEALLNGDFTLDRRSLLQLVAPDNLFGNFSYALNELTVLKRDTSTMISISAYVDGQFLNTYWADGLIIATPTGSTGYSLSCGGPIISPESRNFIITPIATHNLTVRPIVIPDSSTVKLRISGRSQEYLVVLDSRSRPLSTSVELVVKKAGFSINLICLGQKDFFKTIRNKLAWGLDKRN
ncbi:MAG: NAD kinase [Bacteroidales bacterium]|jgi:NAD+ kinase|nr:NAD kinase [Bacteroidales bacterium]NLM91688.1 NAD kinase [Bacteroidales bacterium]